MLPTQFIPEYYRDSKDIVYADDTAERNQGKSGPRQSLIALFLGLFRRTTPESQGRCEAPQQRLANW